MQAPFGTQHATARREPRARAGDSAASLEPRARAQGIAYHPCMTTPASSFDFDATQKFYSGAMRTLRERNMPFLVGGAYAFARYTGIERFTKDFDLFVLPDDCARILELFAREGFHTELTFPHWLGKVYSGGDGYVDIIFGAGNGVARVDREWFDYAADDEVLNHPVKLIPAEEMIWSKAFVEERERYDGADVAHILRACGAELDWPRLVRRFGPHWRVLLSHLVLFGFVYPGERDTIPRDVLRELIARLESDETQEPSPDGKICQGTLLSREQYLTDVNQWGYTDARLTPRGTLTEREVAIWTADIKSER
jgi:hypothetical protein